MLKRRDENDKFQLFRADARSSSNESVLIVMYKTIAHNSRLPIVSSREMFVRLENRLRIYLFWEANLRGLLQFVITMIIELFSLVCYHLVGLEKLRSFQLNHSSRK